MRANDKPVTGHAAALIGSHSDTHEATLAAMLGVGVQATGLLSEIVNVTRLAMQRVAGASIPN